MLELCKYPRLATNYQSSIISFSSADNTGMHHHAGFSNYFEVKVDFR